VAASLIVQLRSPAPFSMVLQTASELLVRLLNLDAEVKLVYELPPARRRLLLASTTAVDGNFPGAYIRLQGIEGSMVNFHVFNSPIPGEVDRLLLSCEASGRGPASVVLAAALSAAAGNLMDGSIEDGGHHWLEKDECSPGELIESLSLREPPPDFKAAVELVYRRMAIYQRYPTH